MMLEEEEDEAKDKDEVYTLEEGTEEVDGGMVGKSRTCLKGLFSGRSLTSLVRSIDLNHNSSYISVQE